MKLQDIGILCREKRRVQNLSLIALGEHLHISPSTIQRFECGHSRQFSHRYIQRLADWANVPLVNAPNVKMETIEEVQKVLARDKALSGQTITAMMKVVNIMYDHERQ